MHVFRLVEGGAVDKMIAFDALPKHLLRDIKTKALDGFPSFWNRWMKENKSVRAISMLDHETGVRDQREQACTFILEYKSLNEDKQKWQEISNYVRKAVDLSVRLLDKIEDMAIKLAKDPHSELSIDPEEIPIIAIPVQSKVEAPLPVDADGPLGPTPAPTKKLGRPKKVALEV